MQQFQGVPFQVARAEELQIVGAQAVLGFVVQLVDVSASELAFAFASRDFDE